jgi:anti-sigma-K factor RskA
MNEIHALSGAYAVDALDDLERARFERHLSGCAECRAEVASLREAAALLSETTASAPPADLRDRVLAGIATVRPLPPVQPVPVRTRHWTTRLVAAAAVVLVVGLGTVAVHPWSHDTAPVADRVLAAQDAVRTEKVLPGGGTATVVSSRQLGRAVLLTRDLADPPSGRTYELWLQDPDGRMQPAGLVDQGGTRTVVLHGDAGTATAAGITIEPAGGSAQPTTEPIALFSLGAT